MIKYIFSLILIFSFSLLAKSVDQEILESSKLLNSWMDLQKKDLVIRDLYPNNPEKSELIISGIPKFVKAIKSDGIVFRHYVGSALDIILETKKLKTGITPYVILNPGFSKETYEDLTGMFLTYPNVPPERVGLKSDNLDYVDFILYEGTPVVEIEKDILLIPGYPDAPAWMKPLYEAYKNGEAVHPGYLRAFQKFDRMGGIHPSFMSIKILSYRKNGRIINL